MLGEQLSCIQNDGAQALIHESPHGVPSPGIWTPWDGVGRKAGRERVKERDLLQLQV